jgi:hypothetical protein
MVINALGGHAVGAPVLGRPNPADFDGICGITNIFCLASACIGRLGRGVPTDSNEHLLVSTEATPPAKIKNFGHLPLHRGGFGAVHPRYAPL